VGCACRFFLVIGLGLLLAAAPVSALVLHVAPDGDDAWSGRLARPNPTLTDGPLASLTGARDAIRQLRANGPLSEPVQVLIADGRYKLAKPFELTPEDTGTAQAFITYEAAPGAHPVFSGGRVIRGWHKGRDGIWQAYLPEVAAGWWYFEQLWVNGQRATRARSPNQNWYYIQDLDEQQIASATNGMTTAVARRTIWLRPQDFAAVASLSPRELHDVNLVVFHNWDITRRFCRELNRTEDAIITTGEFMERSNPWHKNDRFILENALRFLDAPGEWFLSRSGTLYYKPLPGENMRRAEVVAPVVDHLIVIRGDPAAGKYVENIAFRGLSFQHSQWQMPPGGFEPSQAAASIDAAILVDGARDVTFEHCEIAHVGRHGVWFREGCQYDTIRYCYLHDLGAGGIRVGDLKMPATSAVATHHVYLDNNIIRNGGRIFACATGVWVGFSPDNYITHNEIADFFSVGISVGWRWGYGESNCKRNEIAFNRVHHIGQGVLSDMGGIYTLGPSEGTVVHNNVLYDIESYTYGGWGLYTDEGSSGILFENNLVYDTKSGSFVQHYGQGNVIRNNILADAREQQLQLIRVENHLSFTLEHNIVYWTNRSPAVAGNWEENIQLSCSNCYWNAGGYPVRFGAKTLADWQRTPVVRPVDTNGVPLHPEWVGLGRETGSILADPLFVNAAAHDFRLKPGSPALALGFRPFDYSRAGVYGAAAWRQLGRAQNFAPTQIPPAPPPVPIHYTFEHNPVGQPPPDFEVRTENKGDSILVTDETAAHGKKSVKVTDAPGLKYPWEPYLCRQMNFSTGEAHNVFELRLGTNADLSFEWRDWSRAPYQTGPEFAIHDGKLFSGGKELLTLPANEWLNFHVWAKLGAGKQPRWNLEVTLPGKSPVQFLDQPCHSSRFQTLTWIGFSSVGNGNGIFYLDDFAVDVN
jgi:hypothetical protein